MTWQDKRVWGMAPGWRVGTAHEVRPTAVPSHVVGASRRVVPSAGVVSDRDAILSATHQTAYIIGYSPIPLMRLIRAV